MSELKDSGLEQLNEIKAYESEQKARDEKVGNFRYDGDAKLCRACIFEYWTKELFEGYQNEDPCEDCPQKEKEGI